MTHQLRTGATLVAALVSAIAAHAAPPSHIRYHNDRIAEVFDYAATRSRTFLDLVAAIERADVVVYIEEGSCRGGDVVSCLQIMPRAGERRLCIRIDQRRSMQSVVRQLAHELQHAAEIAAAPAVVDDASLQRLYKTIGFFWRASNGPGMWETRRAQAVETEVLHETTVRAALVDPAFFGTWTLDADGSAFNNVAALKNGTRWQRERGYGLISIVTDAVDERGIERRSTAVYRPDGGDYVVSIAGAERRRTITERAVDRYAATFVVKENGETVAFGRRVLDPQGRTLIVESEGVDAAGRGWKSVERWEKRSGGTSVDPEPATQATVLDRAFRR